MESVRTVRKEEEEEDEERRGVLGRVAWAGGRSDGTLPLSVTYSDEGDSSRVAAESLASV